MITSMEMCAIIVKKKNIEGQKIQILPEQKTTTYSEENCQMNFKKKKVLR